jgi:hypothetical protein
MLNFLRLIGKQAIDSIKLVLIPGGRNSIYLLFFETAYFNNIPEFGDTCERCDEEEL